MNPPTPNALPRASPFLVPARWVMDRLTYPRKFALLSLLFLLPLATVMYLLLTEINSRVDFARKELDGTRYLRVVRALQHQVGQSRHLAVAYSLGNATIRPELIRQQAAVDDSLERLLAFDQTTGGWAEHRVQVVGGGRKPAVFAAVPLRCRR